MSISRMVKQHGLSVVTAVVAICAMVVGVVRVRQLIAGPVPVDPSVPVVVADWAKYSEGGSGLGGDDAPVTIVEFSDFRCPYCKKSAGDLKKIRQRYPTEVKFVYRHIPTHQYSREAALAAECGRRQGKFDELHDLLFAESDFIGKKPWTYFAEASGVPDTTLLVECMKSASAGAVLSNDSAAAAKLRISGTPTMLINDLMFRGSHGFLQLDSAVQRALSKSR